MSVLILMRHGRAAFGADTYDSLSETGRAQAVATGSWLAARRMPVTTVWHGPRRRHLETATQVVKHGNLPALMIETPALDEFGEGEELLTLAEVMTGRPMLGPDASPLEVQLRAYDKAIAAWAAGRAAIPGRPDFATFRSIVRGWLDEVLSSDGPRGRIELAVSSAGVIAAAVCELLQLPDHRWIDLLRAIGNGSLTDISFSSRGRGLRSFNATGHLPAELLSVI